MGENLTLSQGELGKVIADAIFKCWELHNRDFPDFNTMGNFTATEITQRFERIERNPEAYRKYFQRELFTQGGASLHVKKEVKTNPSIGATV